VIKLSVKEWLQRRFVSLLDLDKWMDMQISGTASTSGVPVTENTALNATAVLACVKILAETVASLPLPVYQRLEPRGKVRASNHPLYSLLHDQPNPEMTSFLFRETLQGHLGTWGNAYAEIEWDMTRGWPKALWPLRPDRMEPKRENGKIVYIYRLPDGTQVKLPAFRVFHIPGFGYDGLIGYSPISLAKDAIGLSMAAEQYNNRFFKNDGRPGGALRHPGKLTETSHDRLKKSWEEMHTGLSNAHRVAILEEGMEFQEIGFPPETAQLLSTRKFQVQEIARIYRVPLHMVGDLERATFSNIEHQAIEFVVHTVRPWLVRWEQTITSKLLMADKQNHFAEFVIDGLLRGDTQARFEAYSKGFSVGAFSVNEILELENRNPIGKEGDERFVPMNLVPLSMAKEVIEPQEPTNNRSLPPIEQRNTNAAKHRAKLAKRYESLFHDAGARVVAREVKDLRRAVKKHLGERDAHDFLLYLEDYYKRAPEWIQKTMMPVILSLGEVVRDAATQEVGGEPINAMEWLNGYAERYGTQHSASSLGQLRKLIEQAGVEALDPGELIDKRLDEWEEKRPGKIASRETVELSNKMARFVFIGAGITRLRWVALGSNSCPYCQELDGKVVGIDSPFVGADETLESEDGNMRINKPTMTPMLHDGCVCQIVAD
jgi:HK97 family phage portal protein